MKRVENYDYHWGITLRIYPDTKTKQIIFNNGGCSRFVYNRLVAIQQEIYNLKKVSIYIDTVAERLEYLQSIYCNATGLKNTIPFLNGDLIDSDMIYNAIKDYKAAWNMYFENPTTNIPTFHKKDNTYSYKTSNHYSGENPDGLRDGNIRFEDDNHLHLPKIGRIRFKGSVKQVNRILSRDAETRMGSAKIFMDGVGNFYVSLSFASDTPLYKSMPKTSKAYGFDLNLENFLWDSDNNVVENPHLKKEKQEKINKAKKKLSRKRNAAVREGRNCHDSKNYEKQRKRVAKLEKAVSEEREKFHYSVANEIVKNHDYIFGEELKVSNLLKNHNLAYAISDVGWRSFLHRLEWSSEKYGKTMMLVPPHHTTQTCSNCGYVMKGDEKLKLGDREWVCPKCKTYHIRDYNASINIMNKGLEVLKSLGIEPDLK